MLNVPYCAERCASILKISTALKFFILVPMKKLVEPESKVIPVKVEKSSSSLPATPVGEGHVRTPSARTAGDTQPASSTSVRLGASAEQLRSMESGMANTPLVNAAKVAEIKQAISEGRFQVNSGVVADSLIKSVTDLINSHKA